MKRAALGAVLIVLAAGCGSGGSSLPRTHVTLTALNTNVGMAVFHLDCSPAGGDVADPAATCAALAADPRLVTAPKPYTCLGGPSSWFDMTISGRLGGKPVHESFATCLARGMPTIDKFELFKNFNRHIRPRRHGRVTAGRSITFPAGALRPGDLLVCAEHPRITLGLSDRFGPLGSSRSLTGTRHRDGSITARCA
jgi:hypothetical protein